LASLTASASSSNGITDSTGPKISSRAMLMSLDTSGDGKRGDLLPRRGMDVAPGVVAGGRNPAPVDQHEAVAETEFVAMRLDGCDHAPLPCAR